MNQDSRMEGCRYVLAVQDLEKSVAFYTKKMGLKTWWQGDGWHFLKRDNFILMLGECPHDISAFDTNNHSYFAYIDVYDVDSLYSEYVFREIKILSQITDKPWGQREFAIRTIDGHRIIFGENINERA